MNDITLYKTDPAKNVFCFYRLDIQADLFGNQCLIRRWGRIGRAGQTKITPHATLEAAERELAKYQRLKSEKGITFVISLPAHWQSSPLASAPFPLPATACPAGSRIVAGYASQ